MSKAVTFGEIMLRLNPEGYRRIVQSDRFEASYAGGEANVAVSCQTTGTTHILLPKSPTMKSGRARSMNFADTASALGI